MVILIDIFLNRIVTRVFLFYAFGFLCKTWMNLSLEMNEPKKEMNMDEHGCKMDVPWMAMNENRRNVGETWTIMHIFKRERSNSQVYKSIPGSQHLMYKHG